MSARIGAAVIPVGGLGTRFLPATKAAPKEMLPVVDKPLIQYAAEEARAAGIERIVLITARGKSAIADHFDEAPELAAALAAAGKTAEAAALAASDAAPGTVLTVRQPRPLGLGHAVLCARAAVGDEPFAVLLPDDLIVGPRPCLAQMIEAWERTGGMLVAAMRVPAAETGRYGIVAPGARKGRLVAVSGLVEKPAPGAAPSDLAIVGRYILGPAAFAHLERGRRGAGGEIQLTDAIAAAAGAAPVHAFLFEGERFDCGDKLGFLEASIACALARPDMADGMRAILARRAGRA